MATFEIIVYYDTVCPWCYIGHRALEKAIDMYRRTYPEGSKAVFNYIWKPYYLLPDAPIPGVPMLERIATKNGPERVNAICTRLQRVGQAYSIAFDFNGRTGNSRDSLRLVHIAPPELKTALVERLFEAHFEQGGDITSHGLLKRAATDAGLPEAMIDTCLSDSSIGKEVDELAAQARRSGISSVPTIYVAGIKVDGAAEVSELYQVLVEASEKQS